MNGRPSLHAVPIDGAASSAGPTAVAGLWAPDWGLPAGVRALMSTRRGDGASRAPCDHFNLAWPSASVPDESEAVRRNRARFAAALGATPVFLNQVHGAEVVELGPADRLAAGSVLQADASITAELGVACTVLVADCAPVLLCADEGRAVGAVHAGWRGLAAGVVEAAVSRLCDLAACPRSAISAWIGPCIGRLQFEVGDDVCAAFDGFSSSAGQRAFTACTRRNGTTGWLADLPLLVKLRLSAAGVERVAGGSWCTVSDPARFFSHRRDGPCGRMAAAIVRIGPGT